MGLYMRRRKPDTIEVQQMKAQNKDELVAQQQELHEMMIRLEESKTMEAEERARLEDEINSKRSEVEDILTEVQRKEEENRQLQEEMDAARQRQEEASKALMAVSTTPSHHHLREGDDDSEDEEHETMNGNVSRGGDLRDDDDDVSDPVNERLTLAEKNERLQSQLRSLKEDLAHTRDDQAE